MRVLKSLTASRFQQFSLWSKVPPSPLDPILGTTILFKADPSPKKQLLGVGAYRDNDGKPWVLNSVRKAQDIIYKQNLDHEYLPIDGDQEFIKLSAELAYGKTQPHIKQGLVAGIQTLSGCGAVRMGLELIKSQFPNKNVLVPKPTWPIHTQICQSLQMKYQEYSYYNPETISLDFNAIVKQLEAAEEGSVVMLHVCSHNPTGIDPSVEQWKTLKNLMKQKNHIAFFDMAYQGFTSGDLDKDAYSLRLFTNEGDLPIMLAQSYAKNMGLYGQRVGTFTCLVDNKEQKENVEGVLKGLARRMYSNPPIQGSRIVKTILSNPELYQIWLDDIKIMANRIHSMRLALKQSILKCGSTKNWDHITNQVGMFAYTGLNLEQVLRIRKEYSIYMTNDGRISIAGLNTKNVDYVAQSFYEVTK